MAAALPMAVAADVKVVEEIAAKINNDIITRGELEHRRLVIEQELRRQGLTGAKLADAVKQAERDALRDQIDQLLLVQRGKDLDIKIDPDVTRRLAELQVQNNIRDPDQFQEFIRQQTGMPFEDFKQQLTNQILTQRVVGQEIGSRIAIAEPEMQKYYEEHKKTSCAKTRYSEPDSDFHRRQDRGADRRGGKEGQGPFGAREKGREVQRAGRATIPTIPRPPSPEATSAGIKKGCC